MHLMEMALDAGLANGFRRTTTHVAVVGSSSSSGGNPRSTGSIASMGGPLPFDTRSAFRCAFFSSFSRRLFARASSLRRFWNLVFDRLAKALPSRNSKSSGHAQAAPADRRAPGHREYYDRPSQFVTCKYFGRKLDRAPARVCRRPLVRPGRNPGQPRICNC